MTDNPVPEDEGNDDEGTTEPEDPERWPMPAEDPEEEPVHEGAEGDPPEEGGDGT